MKEEAKNMNKKDIKTIADSARAYYSKRELSYIEITRTATKDATKKAEMAYNYGFYDGAYKVLAELYKMNTGEDFEPITIKINHKN